MNLVVYRVLSLQQPSLLSGFALTPPYFHTVYDFNALFVDSDARRVAYHQGLVQLPLARHTVNCPDNGERDKFQNEIFPDCARIGRVFCFYTPCFCISERYYWDATLRIPKADFQEVLHDDRAALAWLLALRQVGIVHLRGAPAEQGQVARLAERIGYLRLTFYGHTWQVQDKSMANNVAYTSGKLSLHTDYPALHFAPGVITKINYNNATRDSVLDLPLHQVQPFYRALKAYVDIMNRPENVVTYTMEPGDMVTFDNWRLLHGRKSYISKPDRLRHLEGAYLDWDEVMSRLRILRRNVHGDV
ncbi:hypothetical protein XENOCAPTIV_011678 [Xenoophorus captivus]|uniref:TauD/TfdA-like domain-containing protein n=1 Tax=Xenoophorus captivus TaxID=1517983 RepID=A0ABV0RDR1_9TELE